MASATAVVLGRKDEVGQPQIRETEVERQEVAAVALESWSEHGEEVKEEGYHSLLFFISISFRHPSGQSAPRCATDMLDEGEQETRMEYSR